MSLNSRWAATAGLSLILVATVAGARPKQDYIVTAAKPDHLIVIDPAKQGIVADYHIPEANHWLGTIVPSPDGKVAYVLVNKMGSISGISLDTGKEVFRANLSSGDERVRSFFAFDVTPDGRELIVHEIPVKLGMTEYTVEDTRFAVFRTNAGLDAQPVRTFPAPRAVSSVLVKKDGKSFYALGFDLYEFDRWTGKQLGERGVRNWSFPNRSVPDLLATRPVSEPSGTFMVPISTTVAAADGKDEPVAKTTIMSLDLTTGDLQYRDVEGAAVALFSTVKSATQPEFFGVYNDLTKFDSKSMTVVQHAELDHTYYAVLVSTDGTEVYAAGAGCDVTIFSAQTLKKKANVRLPGCGDQSATSPRIVRR